MASGAARPPRDEAPVVNVFPVSEAPIARDEPTRPPTHPASASRVSPRNRVRWSSRHPDVAHSPRPPLPRRPAVADPPHPDAAVGASRFRDRPPRPAASWTENRDPRAALRRQHEHAARRRRFASTSYALGDSARAHPASPRTTREPPPTPTIRRAPVASLRPRIAPPLTLSWRCSPPRCTPTLNLSDRNHRRDW